MEETEDLFFPAEIIIYDIIEELIMINDAPTARPTASLTARPTARPHPRPPGPARTSSGGTRCTGAQVTAAAGPSGAAQRDWALVVQTLFIRRLPALVRPPCVRPASSSPAPGKGVSWALVAY